MLVLAVMFLPLVLFANRGVPLLAKGNNTRFQAATNWDLPGSDLRSGRLVHIIDGSPPKLKISSPPGDNVLEVALPEVLGGNTARMQVLLSDTDIYISARNAVACLGPDGSERWSSSTPENPRIGREDGPWLIGGRLLVLVGSQLKAFGPSGNLDWEVLATSTTNSLACNDDCGLIWLGSADQLQLIDAGGNVLATHEVQVAGSIRGRVASDGTLYYITGSFDSRAIQLLRSISVDGIVSELFSIPDADRAGMFQSIWDVHFIPDGGLLLPTSCGIYRLSSPADKSPGRIYSGDAMHMDYLPQAGLLAVDNSMQLGSGNTLDMVLGRGDLLILDLDGNELKRFSGYRWETRQFDEGPDGTIYQLDIHGAVRRLDR